MMTSRISNGFVVGRRSRQATSRSGRRPCVAMAANGQCPEAGFTLIEVMVTLVIIAILTAVALPQYSSYVMKSRRVDAKNALLDLASRQERHLAVNNAYTSDASRLGYGTGATFPVTVAAGGTNYYTLSVPTVTAGSATALPTFVATATPANSQQRDTRCYTFRINSLGVKSNVDSGGAALTDPSCW